MAWILLVIAGLFEVVGVTGINKVNKEGDFRAYAIMIVGFTLSFVSLSVAMQSISMGTAYAVWTGIGTAGGALVGMLFFNESKEWRRILFISLIIVAAVGLKLIS